MKNRQKLNKLKFVALALFAPLLLVTSPIFAQVENNTPDVSTSIPVSPSPPPPSVDLYRLATFAFDPDQYELTALGSLTNRVKHDVDLIVDGDGNPVDCEGVSTRLTAEQVAAMCRSLIAHAEVKIDSYIDLAGQRGRLAVSFSHRRGPTHGLGNDAIFSADFDAAQYRVRLNTPAGGVQECTAWPLPLEVKLAASAGEAICAAYLSDSAIRETFCEADPDASDARPADICGIAVQPLDPPLDWVYSASLREDTLKRTPTYLPPQVNELPLMTSVEGRMIPESIQHIRYPGRASGRGLAGATAVLLGVNANGRVVTCRPVQTSGHVFLDNHTCKGMARYARYSFQDGADQFEGLRYHIFGVNWRNR